MTSRKYEPLHRCVFVFAQRILFTSESDFINEIGWRLLFACCSFVCWRWWNNICYSRPHIKAVAYMSLKMVSNWWIFLLYKYRIHFSVGMNEHSDTSSKPTDLTRHLERKIHVYSIEQLKYIDSSTFNDSLALIPIYEWIPQTHRVFCTLFSLSFRSARKITLKPFT